MPSLERIKYVPFWDPRRGRIVSFSDIVQNIALFMPFGFFGWLTLCRRRAGSVILGSLIMGLIGFAVSFCVEALQTMSASRSPSVTDLATNFTGALVGGAIAAIYVIHFKEGIDATLVRTAQERPGLLIFGAYLVVVVAGSLAPFIPTLDVGLLRTNVREFLQEPWGPKPIGALLTDGLLFAALSFLAAYEIPSYLADRGWLSYDPEEIPVSTGVAIAAAGTTFLALGLEGCQLFIVGHSPGLQDAVVGLIGAVVGAAFAATVAEGTLEAAREFGDLTRRRPRLVIGFSILAPTLRALQPFQFVSFAEAFDKITLSSFVPFWALFQNLTLATFRNVFEVSAYYVPLGYALYALGYRTLAAFLFPFVLAETLEFLQLPIAGRTFDITEGIYAGLCGMVGAWALSRLEERATSRRRSRASYR